MTLHKKTIKFVKNVSNYKNLRISFTKFRLKARYSKNSDVITNLKGALNKAKLSLWNYSKMFVTKEKISKFSSQNVQFESS